MKCQILFSRKIIKVLTFFVFAELPQRGVLKVKFSSFRNIDKTTIMK